MTKNNSDHMFQFDVVDEIPSRSAGRPLSPEIAALVTAARDNEGKWVKVPCANAEETRRWQARVKSAIKRGDIAETATRNGDVYVRAGAQ
jgi:hypothetical protein